VVGRGRASGICLTSRCDGFAGASVVLFNLHGLRQWHRLRPIKSTDTGLNQDEFFNDNPCCATVFRSLWVQLVQLIQLVVDNRSSGINLGVNTAQCTLSHVGWHCSCPPPGTMAVVETIAGCSVKRKQELIVHAAAFSATNCVWGRGLSRTASEPPTANHIC
jgi:hypothetical protein